MDLATRQVPLARMLVIFAGVLILAAVIMFAIGYLFPTIEVPGSLGIVFLMVAAMTAGQSAGAATGRLMTSGEKARFAVLATALGLAMNVAALAGILVWFGVPLTVANAVMFAVGEPVSDAEISAFLPMILGIAVPVSLLVCFFGVGFGARTQRKQAEKLAARQK